MAAGAATALLLNSGSLLDSGLDKAFAQSGAGLSFETPAAKPTAAATSGDEGYWLTQADVKSPAPFADPLSVGDRITIAGSDGRERRLEVVDLKTVGGTATGAVGGRRLLLVSCRVTGAGAERSEALVRFLIEAAAQPAVAQRAKAL
jgi:hypothetical protein